jgi:threonylcarbamoyladenosine tRNA methylthiotransferase CDKAL1
LKKYKFPVLHISQFYPRPGTPAARMKRLGTDLVKARSRRATILFESYTSYDHLLGSIQKVLVTEVSSDTKNYIAHNKSYNQVLVEKDERIMGQWIDVKITEANKWSLKGELLESSLEQLNNVDIKRIPRLIRVGKETVVMESEMFEGERDDGSFYSKGNTKETTADLDSKDIGTTNLWNEATQQINQSSVQAIVLGLAIGFGIVALRSFLKK